MRLGTTLCLHLNNPRARGYAYPRDFVPFTAAIPSIAYSQPTLTLYRVRLSHVRFLLLRAYFSRGNTGNTLFHIQIRAGSVRCTTDESK